MFLAFLFYRKAKHKLIFVLFYLLSVITIHQIAYSAISDHLSVHHFGRVALNAILGS